MYQPQKTGSLKGTKDVESSGQTVWMLKRLEKSLGNGGAAPLRRKEGKRGKIERETFQISIFIRKTHACSYRCTCHKSDGISHRSVCVGLHSSAQGRHGDTAPWSAGERKMYRKTGSLWAVDPGMTYSSCHTSHTDHWCFLRNI